VSRGLLFSRTLGAALQRDQVFDERVAASAAGAGAAGASDLLHRPGAVAAGVQDLSMTDAAAVTDQHEDLWEERVAN